MSDDSHVDRKDCSAILANPPNVVLLLRLYVFSIFHCSRQCCTKRTTVTLIQFMAIARKSKKMAALSVEATSRSVEISWRQVSDLIRHAFIGNMQPRLLVIFVKIVSLSDLDSSNSALAVDQVRIIAALLQNR